MRTKTLLLTAALSAAGIATSMAQAPVYSVNAVGYVNTTLVPGFTLVSNPLDNQAGNTIQNLFGNGIQGTIPEGLTVYFYNPGAGFDFTQWESLDNAFSPASKAATLIEPGMGVFVRNPSNQNVTNTFVGEVPTGPLSHNIPAGFSIQASEVPVEGTVADLLLPAQPNDVLFMFNTATQSYETPRIFDDLDLVWKPALRPVRVGEAFFYQNRNATRPWARTFSVNN